MHFRPTAYDALYNGRTKRDAGKNGSAGNAYIFGMRATGFKVFDSVAAIAGAGTLVPITGFANAVLSPAIEFKAEGHVMGIGAKMFSIAGPVIVFGLTAGVVYGLVLSVFRLF